MISPIEVFEIFRFAEETGFFEMRKLYDLGNTLYLGHDDEISISGEMIIDQPSTRITIKTGKQCKSVENYYGAPKRLIQIENKIKKLARAVTIKQAGEGVHRNSIN